MATQQAMVFKTNTEAMPMESRINGPNTVEMVSSYKQYVSLLIRDLQNKVLHFEAGGISQYINQ